MISFIFVQSARSEKQQNILTPILYSQYIFEFFLTISILVEKIQERKTIKRESQKEIGEKDVQYVAQIKLCSYA